MTTTHIQKSNKKACGKKIKCVQTDSNAKVLEHLDLHRDYTLCEAMQVVVEGVLANVSIHKQAIISKKLWQPT